MYKLKAYLPGLQKYIFVKELNYKTYRNLVKSLYTGDKIKTIELFNLILQDLTDEADIKNITLIDKLAIFLTIREVCGESEQFCRDSLLCLHKILFIVQQKIQNSFS